MYGVLRSRQAINEPPTIYPRRQRFSTCIAYRGPGNLSLHCHGLRIHGYPSARQPYCALSSWTAEQRRNIGNLHQKVNHKLLRTKVLFCSNGRSIARKALAEPGRTQILNRRPFSYSHSLCATEFEEQARIRYVPRHFVRPVDRNTESQTVRSSIRERMRIWETANPMGSIKEVMPDEAEPGQVENAGMHGTQDARRVDTGPDDSDGTNGDQLFFEHGELVDLGNNRPFLLRGDMVELSLSSLMQPELAIFVRQVESFSQFYTISGKWVNRNSNFVDFYVPNFLAPEALDDLLPYLPPADSPLVEQNKLQSFENALPRHVGASLVGKMLRFRHQTEKVYRDFADSLDQAYQTVASENVMQYYTLHQLAGKLLPRSVELSDGQYSMPVLYAVHRALMRDGLGFRTEATNHRHGSRNGSRYEVVPKIEHTIAKKVTGYVREFQENQTSREIVRKQKDLPLAEFVIKTQRLIDASRKHRELTKSGTLGPYKGITNQTNVSSMPSEVDSRMKFTDTDVEIIRFIESWAAMRNFRTASQLNGIGSLILRATSRYDGFDLDPTTAWTFLQEIGILAPWNNRVSFDLRLPQTGFQLSAEEDFSRRVTQTPSDLPLKDRMEALRRDWGSLPVYCVDDVGALEIDDGVSLERIGDSYDEYWIHIHTADPASHIDPLSDIAKHAERMVSSIYLPERNVSMIPREITSSLFSLANGRPSLTFSARMNNAGDILDIKVTPGYVRNVKFITPSVIDEIISGTILPENQAKVYTVGRSVPSESSISHSDSERNLLQATDLTNEDKENLRKLNALGNARFQKGIERGALPSAASNLLHAQEPSISVRLNGETLPPSSSPKHYDSDPTIEVRCSDGDDTEIGIGRHTVTNLMLLGGEIAARWCHDRGIPIPYRVSPQSPEQANAATYFRDIVLPALQNPGEDARRKVKAYLLLVGRVSLSTVAGPHLLLGISKFAKCTSPLRRFGDLLVHWQIEAALLEEARTGQSLLGSTREDCSYLPFSRDAIDDMIPTLDGKERGIKKAWQVANYSWTIQFVLRAWKFKEYALPQTFECQITQVQIGYRESLVTARINFLGIIANLEVPEWIIKEDVKMGDAYECEFSDVNFYNRKIFLKPLRRISVGGSASGI